MSEILSFPASSCNSPAGFSTSQTPATNRGLDYMGGGARVSVRIDFLQGTFCAATLDSLKLLISFVCGFAGDKFEYHDNGLKAGIWWAFSGASSAYGVRVAWNELEDGTYQGWLSVPGKVWGSMPLRDAWRLCAGLYHRWGLKCNRLDIALDDYARRITPIELDELLTANPDYLCHGKSFEGVYHFDRKTRQKVQTTYLGSRKSDCFHRVYDAKPVHDKDAIRWELQAKRKPAHTIYQGFCTIQFDGGDNCQFDTCAALMLGQFVVGCVDFRYCDGDRLSRRTRLEWWQSLIDEIGSCARPTPPSVRDCIRRTKAWLDNQVAPMLAVVEQIMGAGRFRQYIDSLCAAGVARHRARHENLISVGRSELAALGC